MLYTEAMMWLTMLGSAYIHNSLLMLWVSSSLVRSIIFSPHHDIHNLLRNENHLAHLHTLNPFSGFGAASTAACTSSAFIVTGNSMLKRILPLKLTG